ncbi:hypothetical protein HMPREF9264_0655 [Lactobacillus delbrueckii subsp. bulgaricus PB2003/044-T3-4]|nr:hypothetical protein HMPREF9264_0655 [Lactobacillus delbrueckii subsp. bulgaricus PB2003/044-T3-4]
MQGIFANIRYFWYLIIHYDDFLLKLFIITYFNIVHFDYK